MKKYIFAGNKNSWRCSSTKMQGFTGAWICGLTFFQYLLKLEKFRNLVRKLVTLVISYPYQRLLFPKFGCTILLRAQSKPKKTIWHLIMSSSLSKCLDFFLTRGFSNFYKEIHNFSSIVLCTRDDWLIVGTAPKVKPAYFLHNFMLFPNGNIERKD